MKNWAGNLEYRAAAVREPTTTDQLQETVRSARRIHALGSRHSFNDVADGPGDLVSLARMPRVIDIDREAEIVRADGELVVVDAATDDRTIEAAVVSLGALGVVTALVLRVEPTFQIRQDVYEDLPVARSLDDFASLASAADSVSFFTDWTTATIDQVWLKRRVDRDAAESDRPEMFGARRATVPRHPIRGMSPAACTTQLGEPGPWFERLPHFRMDHTPSSGDELQTEYLVGFEHAADAFLALDRSRAALASLVQVTEIRTIAADRLWLSPASERPSGGFPFTWRPDEPAVRAILPVLGEALRPFGPRPHGGKLFSISRD